jgi:hypothetical protein
MTGATSFTAKALDPSKYEVAESIGRRLIVVMHSQYRFGAHARGMAGVSAQPFVER